MNGEEEDDELETRRHSPVCAQCGETVQFNRFLTKVGRPPSPRYPEGIPKGGTVEGWSHWHGRKVGHEAEPPPGMTGESYLIRRQAGIDQARMTVKKTLQRNFDELHARDVVNNIFKDRRD
jgi:hypothetical protein